ncbi:STAS domain-containing protein [Garciella nitratireducens]|uniref:Anti-sigma factor antagonist n=1 Tax=Garciella nitratireducens DSM 15102 TaxID=1121911 RepID=A0A1T4NHD3_9FIRM|nr:STAS domain-containing protein [Garciella nitratireducens]SJZ78158.1 anti-sigma B factor antagonist [Garciella nitratireducens DSM 15102]
MILQIKDQFNENENRWEITLEGEVDVYTVNNLKERLSKRLEEKMEDIQIDCTSLRYIDSMGLGALIGIRGKMSEKNKKLILKNVQPNVRRLLKITQLDKIFIVE